MTCQSLLCEALSFLKFRVSANLETCRLHWGILELDFEKTGKWIDIPANLESVLVALMLLFSVLKGIRAAREL